MCSPAAISRTAPRLFIDAIASAQIAARSMHDYLRGTRTEVVVRKQWKPAAYTMADGWNVIARRIRRCSKASARRLARNYRERFTEAEARRQGSRCLRCNVNTVFDTSICVACNGCVDVCPENLIRLMGLSKLIRTPTWMAQAVAEFGDRGIGAFRPRNWTNWAAVMMKDETTCIRCACALRAVPPTPSP